MQIFASPVASERAKTSVVKRSSSLVFNLEQTSKIVKKKGERSITLQQQNLPNIESKQFLR